MSEQKTETPSQPEQQPAPESWNAAEAIAKLPDCRRNIVKPVVEILDDIPDSAHPVEAFIYSVLMDYASNELTPDLAESMVSEFRENWEYMLQYARWVQETYPDEL